MTVAKNIIREKFESEAFDKIKERIKSIFSDETNSVEKIMETIKNKFKSKFKELGTKEIEKLLKIPAYKNKIIEDIAADALKKPLEEKFKTLKPKEAINFLIHPLNVIILGKTVTKIEDTIRSKFQLLSFKELENFLLKILQVDQPPTDILIRKYELNPTMEPADLFDLILQNNISRKVAEITKDSLKEKIKTANLTEIKEFFKEIFKRNETLAIGILMTVKDSLKVKFKTATIYELSNFLQTKFNFYHTEEKIVKKILEMSGEELKDNKNFETADLEELEKFFTQLSIINKDIAKNLAKEIEEHLIDSKKYNKKSLKGIASFFHTISYINEEVAIKILENINTTLKTKIKTSKILQTNLTNKSSKK